ncbi:hypothetical protein ACTWJ9_31750 (plasmid) [Streptomyces sp. GDS52]|uniref:hypothetical protein n=1 Tax=Streptomyces sp. GDS52 TaxID=3406419 RepID=UPI003FD25C75
MAPDPLQTGELAVEVLLPQILPYTVAPAPARAFTAARPMPEAAPVTTAILPSSSIVDPLVVEV